MTAQSLEQLPAPERHLDNGSPGSDNTVQRVDRVALLKDYQANQVSSKSDLPGLTLTDGDRAYGKPKAMLPHCSRQQRAKY